MLEKYKVNLEHQKKLVEKFKREKLYIDFVLYQEPGFIRVLDYVYTKVECLKKDGIVSKNTIINARIKAINSALDNFKRSKTLDDVFGIEIICQSENEILIIKKELEKSLTSFKTRIHNKENGYKAIHESYLAGKNQQNNDIEKWKLKDKDVPFIECQFKTIDVALNPEANHHDYKEIDKNYIQEELNKYVWKIGREIPKMWTSSKNGMTELSYEEVIKKIYSFIDIKYIKKQIHYKMR